MEEQITFPDLYLRFDVPYIAFKIGGFGISWQVLITLAGIIIALYLAYKSKENYYIKLKDLLEMMVLTFVVGFVGARLFYCIFRYDTYLEDPIKIMQLEYGYLELMGGMVIGIAVLRALCKSFDLTRKDVFDYFTPFFALIQAFASIAAMYNLRDYGVTDMDGMFRMICRINGMAYVTHPLFLYQAVMCLGLFVITRLMQKKRAFQGQIFYTYLLLFSTGRFFIEGLRRDPMMLFGFNVGKFICFVLIVESIIFLGINIVRKLNNPNRNIKE
jgi:phosphatidylglycerol:prolipoprotein diacylglycerol transferase